MTPLNREALLAAAVPKTKTVEVPGVGAVIIRKLSIRAKKEWADMVIALPTERQDEALTLLVIAGAVNPDGSPMFTPDDKDAVAALDPDAVQTLFSQIQEFSGMGAKALENATKN